MPGFSGTALTLGETVSDTIAVNGEQDVFTFTLDAPTRLYFDSLSTTNIEWTLAGPPGVVVSARNFNGSDSFDFTGNPAIELPAGDYGLEVDGRLVAVAERKSLADLVSSLVSGKLRFAVADLAALPRGAVVVEDRYSQVFQAQHVRPALIADGLAELQVRWP